MSFSTATAVARSGEVYHSEICPGWDIHGNANGGYLMARLDMRLHPEDAHFHEGRPSGGRLVAQSRQLALMPRA